MRIIRFLGEDGRVHHGEAHDDGSATVLLDPQGVFGSPDREQRDQIFQGLRALVADDDENMRRLMTAVLEKVGCACTVAADGAEAMQAIEADELDMVVSDIIMPEHNGYEIFSAAREKRSDMPVVLVTGFGYDPNHSLVKASREGLTAVLYKPFTPQQLLDELERAVQAALTGPADTLQPLGPRLRIRRALAPLEPRAIVSLGPADGGAGRTADPPAAILRPSTAVTCSGQPIPVPGLGAGALHLHGTGRLAVAIGAEAEGAREDEIGRVILGYTAALDLSIGAPADDGEPPGGAVDPGFDIPCSLGPVLVTPRELDRPGRLAIRTAINDEIVRERPAIEPGRSVDSLISALSFEMTLEPGMVILIGGPEPEADDAASGSLKSGDEIAIEIDGIGRLVNRLTAI
ncbi:MAG: fumarylacetoacetate hydrolase family protein [Planctomycetota bacterium]|nr:fumarylacetoacetate hydrolase family protein [Planctomycetota bacterium]